MRTSQLNQSRSEDWCLYGMSLESPVFQTQERERVTLDETDEEIEDEIDEEIDEEIEDEIDDIEDEIDEEIGEETDEETDDFETEEPSESWEGQET